MLLDFSTAMQLHDFNEMQVSLLIGNINNFYFIFLTFNLCWLKIKNIELVFKTTCKFCNFCVVQIIVGYQYKCFITENLINYFFILSIKNTTLFTTNILVRNLTISLRNNKTVFFFALSDSILYYKRAPQLYGLMR